MMYLYIAIALLVGLLLGKALFGKKSAPAPAPAPVAAVPAAPQEDEDEIAAVIAAIAAMMGCAPEQVRILSLREDSPWRPTLLISDGGQIDEKIPDKKISELLHEFNKEYGFTHVTNPVNLGYTKTVNNRC